MASRVMRLIVKPAIIMRNTAPISEIGIAITGMSRERTDPRNRKMTATTIRSVWDRVTSTSWIALSMYSVESYGMPAFMPTGSWASISGITLRTRWITSSVLAPGSTQTPMNVAPCPSKRTSCS